MKSQIDALKQIKWYFCVVLQFRTSSQFVLENSSREDKHECPFARSSIELTLILCEILRIGEPRKLTSTWRYHKTIISGQSISQTDWNLSYFAIVTILSCVGSLRNRIWLPPHLLQSGPALGGAFLCVHSAAKQDLEGDESHTGRLWQGRIPDPAGWLGTFCMEFAVLFWWIYMHEFSSCFGVSSHTVQAVNLWW